VEDGITPTNTEDNYNYLLKALSLNTLRIGFGRGHISGYNRLNSK
jgi:hypothetical protein